MYISRRVFVALNMLREAWSKERKTKGSFDGNNSRLENYLGNQGSGVGAVRLSRAEHRPCMLNKNLLS